MDEMIIIRAENAGLMHKNEHENYEYIKHELVPLRKGGQCKLNLYEIPPHKSAYPYHYHTMNEEVFYILQGRGLLKTPEGERIVTAGDVIFFPANENGAHKLTNISDTENLVYLDFDTCNDIDVTFYPDSGKIGVWGKDINQLYKIRDQVEYYEGE
jgi:uncharacterized cupin superfamily protein